MSNSPCCSGCHHCVSRRGFIKGGSAMLASGALAFTAFGEEEPKTKVAVVFLANSKGREMWPYPNFDCGKRHAEIMARLKKACPGIEFVEVAVANPADGAKALALKDQVDGYVVYCTTLAFPLRRVMNQIVGLGKPTIIADEVLGGSANFLVGYSSLSRGKHPVVGVSSRNEDDLAAVCNVFTELKKSRIAPEKFVERCEEVYRGSFPERKELACKEDKVVLADIADCVKKFKESKFLIVGRGKPGTTQDFLGATGVYLGFDQLKALYDKADKGKAKEWAGKWTGGLGKVLDAKPEVIEGAAAMYLATEELLKQNKTDTITMNCLGGFASGKLPAYPCLGFMQILNDGGQGVCEAQPDDSLSMMMARILTGRPGYVSDPAIDTSKNQVIYAHCVATTKVFGPKGEANGHAIQTLHNRDPRGACAQSFMPPGYMTTTFRTNTRRKELIIHQAKAVDNLVSDYGCRTKLMAEVKGDIEKLFHYWDQFGWHRVTVYGDVKEPLVEFGKALGLKIIEEA